MYFCQSQALFEDMLQNVALVGARNIHPGPRYGFHPCGCDYNGNWCRVWCRLRRGTDTAGSPGCRADMSMML